MISATNRVSIDAASTFVRRDYSPAPVDSGVRATRGVLFSVLLAVPFWAMVGLLFLR